MLCCLYKKYHTSTCAVQRTVVHSAQYCNLYLVHTVAQVGSACSVLLSVLFIQTVGYRDYRAAKVFAVTSMSSKYSGVVRNQECWVLHHAQRHVLLSQHLQYSTVRTT